MNTEINKILQKIRDVKIAVYGDFCLDVYLMMNPTGSEISVETGQQAKGVERHYCSPGGAANVAANIAALKPKSLEAIGVIGADMHGRELLMQLQKHGVETKALLAQKANFETYTFTKMYIGEKEEGRFDFGFFNQRSRQTDQGILKNIQWALENCDVLVFNQQVPGSISNPEFIKEANKLFETYNDKIVLLDSRHYKHQFKNIYLKLNEIEVAQLNGIKVGYQDYVSLSDVERYGLQVFEKHKKPVFITCGNRGIVVVDEEGTTTLPALQLLSKIDTVGAGDTVLSALALCLGAGFSPLEAARFANFAAAVSIQKLFTTGTASGQEILEISRDANFSYQPELARNLRQAKYVEGTEIELCYEAGSSKLGHIKYAVFDHDGTISTLREGWQQIMEPVMIKAILGQYYETADNALFEKIRLRVVEYIEWSTGIQTILQMEALAQMVEEYKLVPKDQILDKFGYKKVFNDALLEMVDLRMAKFKKGNLGLSDFTMKGAVDFLQALKEKGVKLYLASGTDKDDVIKEAELLGYANLFEGQIYGSVGDVRRYSKQMVLNKIIKENALKGEELIVFGDGPVEIQECRKVGGIAVGIASDEPRRYGLNLEKRSKLIKSGADIIVPDFSEGERLLQLIMPHH